MLLELPDLQATFLGNVYNSSRLGWEPVIEPWRFSLHADATRSPAHPSAAITLSAERVLELTASLVGSDSAAAAGALLQRVADVWMSPSTLESALVPVEGLSARNPPFWLLNQTGNDISFHLGDAAAGAAPTDGMGTVC